MLLSPSTMHLLLVLCFFSMLLVAVFFLRQRHLTFFAYLGWGLLAFLLPVLGPFVVIWVSPGESYTSRRRVRRIL